MEAKIGMNWLSTSFVVKFGAYTNPIELTDAYCQTHKMGHGRAI